MKKELEFFKKGYYVDCNGYLYNRKNIKINCHVNSHGYYITFFRLEGKMYTITLHRFVAFIKYGNQMYRDSFEVRHLNGNKLDNSFNNILIGTHKDNMLDKSLEDRMKYAINASTYMCKYSKELVNDINEYYSEVKSYKKTMFKYNITSKGTLHYILNYRLT